MQQNNQPARNNPWGFQASNWSQPITRGPPPQQQCYMQGPPPQQQPFTRGLPPAQPFTSQHGPQVRMGGMGSQSSIQGQGRIPVQHIRNTPSNNPASFHNNCGPNFPLAPNCAPQGTNQMMYNHNSNQNMQLTSTGQFPNNMGSNQGQQSSGSFFYSNNMSFPNNMCPIGNNTSNVPFGSQGMGSGFGGMQQGSQFAPGYQGGNTGMTRGQNSFQGPRGGAMPRPRGCGPVQNFQRPSMRPRFASQPNFTERSPGSAQHRPPFQPNRHEKQKKKKPNKRDLPENNKYYCETCDRGYRDEDKYQIHCDTHEKCPEEGCKYTAAGKLVQLHIKLHHQTGLAKKIWSLESKEDIERWREERKRNFPTAENIEKKKAVLAEKIARGEVIEDKYFGKMHRRDDNRRGRGGRRGRNRGRGHHNRDAEHNDLKRKLEETIKEEVNEKKQKMAVEGQTLGEFFTTADSSDSSSDSSDDSAANDDDNKTNRAETGSSTSTVPAAAGALHSLITSYVGSEESSDDDDDNNNNQEKDTEKKTETYKEESKIENQIHPKREQHRRRRQRHKNKGQQQQQGSDHNKKAFPPNFDKSLLEKLLAKDIRQERNKIMQCVHYIVKNNFFDACNTNTRINGQV